MSLITSHDGIDWTTHIVLQGLGGGTTVEYLVRREAAMMSELIKNMLDGQEAGVETIVPFEKLEGKYLKYVVDYIEHHHGNLPEPIEKPIKAELKAVVSEWDYAFLMTDLVKGGDEKDNETLIQVIVAANHLGIAPLLDLTTACMACLVRGKTTEQIRTLFNITNDFTPEEEARIAEENKWSEEA